MSKKIESNDKLEALTELVKAHMQRFDNTRKIQWTFNGLFWSGIILSAPFLKSIHFNPSLENRFLWFSLIIGFAYSVVLFLFQRSLDWDKDKFKYYRELLEKLIDVKNKRRKEGVKWSIVWTMIQLLVTGMLLIGVYQILR